MEHAGRVEHRGLGAVLGRCGAAWPAASIYSQPVRHGCWMKTSHMYMYALTHTYVHVHVDECTNM